MKNLTNFIFILVVFCAINLEIDFADGRKSGKKKCQVKEVVYEEVAPGVGGSMKNCWIKDSLFGKCMANCDAYVGTVQVGSQYYTYRNKLNHAYCKAKYPSEPSCCGYELKPNKCGSTTTSGTCKASCNDNQIELTTISPHCKENYGGTKCCY